MKARASIGLAVACVVALAGCTSEPEPVPTVADGAVVSFETYRQAHLAFLECLEPHGAQAAGWTVLEDLGQPEISYAIEWLGTDLEGLSEEEMSVVFDEIGLIEQTCEAEHLTATRAAYANNPGAETLRNETQEQRWERLQPAVVECFVEEGFEVDLKTPRSELGALHSGLEHDAALGTCLQESGWARDLGGGFWEIEF